MTDVDRVIAAARRSGDTLTANPREHIARARRILARGQLSELLYAALELRFALERIAQTELVFSESASNRMLDQYSASKKVANLRKLAPESEHRHDVEIRHAVTGEWSKIDEGRTGGPFLFGCCIKRAGEYEPVDDIGWIVVSEYRVLDRASLSETAVEWEDPAAVRRLPSSRSHLGP